MGLEKNGKKKSSKVLFLITISLFLCLFISGVVSSLDWSGVDNYQNFVKEGEYGTIEVWDTATTVLFQTDDRKLTSSVLNFNTNQCLINCKAQPTITLYEDGALIEDIRYIGTDGKEVSLENSFTYLGEESYPTQIVDLESSKEICVKNLNGTDSCSWDYVYKNIIKIRQVDIDYNIGDIVPAGIYNITILATKSSEQSVDWQIKVKGQWHTAWAWWNSDWARKKLITINTTDSDRNQTSVLINVSYDSDMSSNFSDLRFSNNAEDTELGYWFYNNSFVDSNAVEVWVKVGDLSATSNKTIYMYYGNDVVETTSNIAGAFMFGDDFLGVSLNASWSGDTASFSVADGIASHSASGSFKFVRDNSSYNEYIMESRMRGTSVGSTVNVMVDLSSTGSAERDKAVALHSGSFLTGINTDATGGSPSNNVWYRGFFENPASGNAEAYWKDDVIGADLQRKSDTPDARTTYVGLEGYTSTGSWDWIYMRRYTNSSKIITTFGAEESADSSYPQFTSYTESPTNNTAYSLGANYSFNVTVTQTNGTIGLDFNSVNHTAFNSTGTIFNTTITDLSAGTYAYYWWGYGNGTSTLYNTSESRSYTIAKESSVVYTYLNDSRSDITIQNNTAIWLNSSLITGDAGATLTLYNNGTIINSGTSPLSNLTAFNTTGMFNITTIYTSSQNYTVGSETWWVNVTALDTTNPSITINTPLNQSYNTNSILFNITATDETLMDSCWYSLNSGIDNITMTNISSEYIDTNSSMNQGSHIVNFYCNDSSNNVNDSEVEYFFIDSINPSVTLLTESPSDPTIYSFGGTYEFNATITDTNLQTILIEFDGTNYTPTNIAGDVYNFSISDLSVGTYNYYWYANDSVGNINSSESGTYTINKATPTGTLAGTSPITYGTAGNVEGTETNSGDNDLVYRLHRGGTIVSNPDNSVLGVGTYNYIYNVTSGQNYTAVSSLDTFALTINIATGDGTLLLNGSATNYTINRTVNVNITATLDIGSGDISVYIDTTLFQTGSSPISDQEQFNTLGWYLINFTYPGNENYTGFEKYLYVNVTANPLAIVSIVYPIAGDYEAHFTQLNYTVLYGKNCWYDLGEGGGYVVITCGDNVTGITSVDDSNTWTIKVENLDGFNTTDSVIFTIDLPIDYSTFTLRMVDVLKICIMLSGLFIIVMAAKSFFLGDSSFGRLFFICVVVGLAVLFILLLGPIAINYISTLIK